MRDKESSTAKKYCCELVSKLNGLLLKVIFAESKTVFDKSKSCSRRFEKSSRLSAGLKRVQSAFLPLH
jgi:hypothetical protein